MKVLATPRSFASYSKEPINKLKDNSIELQLNTKGDIYTEEELKELVKDLDGIIIGVDPLTKDVLKNAKNLSVISKYGVGLDNIDLAYCEDNGIEVKITAGANNDAVADYAFALILAVARRVCEIDAACRKGDWKKRISLDIKNKKLGILGLGAIGKQVALRSRGFDMELYGYDIFEDKEFNEKHNIKFTSVEKIFKECDFISIHLPLTEDTRYLINKDLLSTAKKELIIVNTARGGVINEDDLYQALKNGQIYGAGIDVFEEEPATDSPLLTLDNVIVGSHCSASSIGATDKMSMMAVDNLLETFRKQGKI